MASESQYRLLVEGEVNVTESRSVSSSIERDVLSEVDRIWREARSRPSSHLHNGPIFSVGDVKGSEITGSFTEYKYWFAQLRDPNLFSVLKVRPLAVTGITRVQGSVLIGQRSREVTQDAGCWELMPSGGVDMSCRTEDDSVDIVGMLSQEFTEELGLSFSSISNIVPKGAIEDMRSHVVDILFDLEVTLTLPDALKKISGHLNKEHTEIKFLDMGSAGDEWRELEGSLAPLTEYLFRHTDLLVAESIR